MGRETSVPSFSLTRQGGIHINICGGKSAEARPSASGWPAQPEPWDGARAGLFRQRLGTLLVEDSLGDIVMSVQIRWLQHPLGFEVVPIQLGGELDGAFRRWT